MLLSFTEYLFLDMSNTSLLIIAYIFFAFMITKIICNYINAKHDIEKAKLAAKNNKK